MVNHLNVQRNIIYGVVKEVVIWQQAEVGLKLVLRHARQLFLNILEHIFNPLTLFLVQGFAISAK